MQYAIKGEYKIATSYSESTKYRGYCKAEGCKWMIHVSQLQDEKTWKVLMVLLPFLPFLCTDFLYFFVNRFLFALFTDKEDT